MAEQGRWDRYWFGEASLVRLAVFRIVMMLAAFYALWHFRIGVFQHAGGEDPSFLARTWHPIYAFDLLGIGPPGAAAAKFVFWALLSSLVLGAVGLFTRVACASAALLTFYWIGTHYSFGKPHHDCVVLMFGLAALPFAPVGARLSVDSLLHRLRLARSGGDPLAVPEQAAWAGLPIRIVQVTAALGYFFSGASKLAIGGFDWANGYTLQGIMLEYNSPWTQYFVEHVELCGLMSAGLLFVQASFPLIFVWRPLRWFYLPMAVLFHLLAMQTMATGPFITLWFTLAAFVELEKVPAFLERNLLRAALPRRLFWWVVTVGCFAGTAYIYTLRMPSWFLLVLIPLIVTGLLACIERAKLGVVFDRGDAAARRAVAWLAAFDWAGRLRFDPSDGAAIEGGLSVTTAGGMRSSGAQGRTEARARLPLYALGAPWSLLRWSR